MNINHAEILAKKQARLSKHSGRALRRKLKAYNKAVKLYGAKGDTLPSPALTHWTERHNVSTKPVTKPAKKPVTVETGIPKWNVTTLGKSPFTVQASNEKDARTEARKMMGIWMGKELRSLPPGTKVERA